MRTTTTCPHTAPYPPSEGTVVNGGDQHTSVKAMVAECECCGAPIARLDIRTGAHVVLTTDWVLLHAVAEDGGDTEPAPATAENTSLMPMTAPS